MADSSGVGRACSVAMGAVVVIFRVLLGETKALLFFATTSSSTGTSDAKKQECIMVQYLDGSNLVNCTYFKGMIPGSIDNAMVPGRFVYVC